MNKKTLLKSVLVLCIGGFVAASCSHDTNIYDVTQAGREKASNFESSFRSILDGNIDKTQDWNTTTPTELTIVAEQAGTVVVFADTESGTPASLAQLNVAAGTNHILVAKPNDRNLYAAMFNKDGSIRVAAEQNGVVTLTAKNNTTAKARQFRTQTRYNIDFPDAPDASKYLADVPAGVQKYDEVGQWGGYASGVSYIDPSHTAAVNIWGNWDGTKTSGGTLYVKGYNDYSNRDFYVAPNTDIYLVAGATLILKDGDRGAAGLQAGSNIYIAEGATLQCNGELRLNSYNIYNAGTVKAPKLTLNASNGGTTYSLLYNQGTTEVGGEIAVENASAYIINEGTLTAYEYGSHGSGNFWNKEGVVTITTTTTVNSNSNVWINEGEYTTEDFNYTAGSINVWNLCKLYVTDNFLIKLGDSPTSTMNFDAGSMMIANTFEMQGPSRINMAGNSIIKVVERATMNITKAEYGIWGPTTGDLWAVFQCPDIVAGRETDLIYQVNYGGNLYVACDSHFPNGLNGHYPYIEFYGNATVISGQENAPIVIPANGKCSDGYRAGGTPIVNPNPTPEPDPVIPNPVPATTQYCYYAFEDLGDAYDIDFNDVVLRVSAPVDGKVNIQLCTVGGDYDSDVYLGNENLGEVHTLFGIEKGTYEGKDAKITSTSEAKFVTIKENYELKDGETAATLDLSIEVKNIDGKNLGASVRIEKSKNNGDVPQMLVVNGNDEGKFFWAQPGIMIYDAYPQFTQWAVNKADTERWHYLPRENKVVKY